MKVGNKVLFNAGTDQFQLGFVVYVWSDLMVNLVVFDSNGVSLSHTSKNVASDKESCDIDYCTLLID